jgi:hypothetical protein
MVYVARDNSKLLLQVRHTFEFFATGYITQQTQLFTYRVIDHEVSDNITSAALLFAFAVGR